MGTNNFHYKNTAKCYAICMASEEPVLDENDNETGETEYRQPEQEECEDTLDWIREQIEEKKQQYTHYDSNNGKDPHESRSFPSHILGTLAASKDFGALTISIECTAVARSGYYEGACLDYFTEVRTDGTTYEDGDEYSEEDFREDYSYYTDHNKGLCSILASHAHKWACNEQDRLEAYMESIFAQVAGHTLEKIGSASNGETFYKEVK